MGATKRSGADTKSAHCDKCADEAEPSLNLQRAAAPPSVFELVEAINRDGSRNDENEQSSSAEECN
jgi:hypothetical protein